MSADNDASLGALAEHLFGAGRGVDDLVYLNGGASGIGGGVIVRGLPSRAAAATPASSGQNRPGAGDRLSDRGTLEDEVSARACSTCSASRTPTNPRSPPRSPPAPTRESPTNCVATRGFWRWPSATRSTSSTPTWSCSAANLATLLAWRRADLVAAVEASSIPAAAEGVTIAPAALGEDRLLIGAAELAYRSLLRDPAAWLDERSSSPQA